MPEERPFRLRPRRPRREPKDDSKAWSKTFKGLMHIVRMTTKPRSRREKGGSGGVSAYMGIRQRCAVRVTYSPNRVRGQWAAHGRYIVRDSATQATENRGTGFNASAEDIDIAKTLDTWQKAGDPRLFKLIVSPEFGERMDLRQHARDLMRRVEQDLAAPLEWVAVEHFNTAHPHVHVVLRGVARDQPLRLDRAYIKNGIRRHAEDLCTARLGFRTQADALEAERQEIGQTRFTSLDRTISRAKTGAATDADVFAIAVAPGGPGSEFRREHLHHVKARLRVLETMGLARSTATGVWSVRADFETVLRAMQRLNDRQRMLAAHAELLSDPRLPVQHSAVRDLTHLEGRVIGHSLEEMSGITYMILEGTDAKVHLVAHTDAIQSARQRGLLKPNSFVRLWKVPKRGRSDLEIRDFGDADQYLRSSHFRHRSTTRATQPASDWGGWLGRYHSALHAAATRLHERGRTS